MKSIFSIALILYTFAGGLTAQVSQKIVYIEDRPPEVSEVIPNMNAWIEDIADTIDLSQHFTDPDSPETPLSYTVLSIQNENVASASLSSEKLIINYLSNGQTYMIIEAMSDGLAVADTFTLGVNTRPDETGCTIATFDDLNLDDESYWNGSDESGSFSSGNVTFYNDYNAAWFSWTGWAYSSISDILTPGYANQYSAYTGAGLDPLSGENYAISYHYLSTALCFNDGQAHDLKGCFITNTTYAALSMKNGDDYTKKFGGESGDDEDWFNLRITGFNNAAETGSVDFKLADFTHENNDQDYIIETWQWVDLSGLGSADSITFTLSSTDNGDFGMNTPSYFALDNLFVSAFPSSTLKKHSTGNFVLYPNPSNGVFRINTGFDLPSGVSVYNVNGKLVKSLEACENGQQINMGNCPSGIYIIKVTNDAYTKQQSIVIH